MERYKIGILIPALNEVKTIGRIVKQCKRYGKVFVVDDGSKDSTSIKAKQNGAVVIKNKKNLGYDTTLEKGFKFLQRYNYDFLITFDADNQFSTSQIAKIMNNIDNKTDLIIGERNIIFRISEKIYSLYTKLFFNINDPLCGIKCYRVKIFKKIGFFDRYNSIGTDLMFEYIKRKAQFKNIRVNVKKRKGKPRFGNTFIANFKIFKSLILHFYYNVLT